ncbi:MAG: PKD domain-containing protein, partial [Bacteroidia bacterium]
MHSLVKYLLLASLFLFIKPAQAQQGNVWAFGYQTGLDFNYSPPKVISSASRYPLNSNLPAFASTSVSDCNGKLLFYSNGTEVFDRNHERMPHGLLTNWSYGFIYAIKSPADSNKYYLFTSVDSFYQQYHNITYTVIDMSLNNGNGDVDTTQKNIVFHGKSKQMNTFTIVGNSNKKDYWVITNSYEEVIIYPLTKSGIGAPNYYNLPAKLDSNASVVGAFFANHKGSKLVLAQTYFEPAWAKYRGVIFDFNNTTGRISKSTPFMDKKLAEHFLVEFSPDDSLMYANTGFLTPRSESLYQFEVYATNIDNSRQLLKQENVTSGSGYFIMRLGPDNKIYVGKYQDTLMGIIHNPNRKGLKCNYKENEINLAPGYFGDMMPNVYFPVKNLDFRIKAGCTDTVRFTNLSDTSYFKNFKWYFGDGDSSSKYSPKHAYATSGKYFVKLLGINQCGAKQWYSDTIEVWVPAKPGFKKDTVIYSCGQALLYLSSTSKDSSQHYGYTFGDLLSADTSINPIHIYYKAGKYLLKQVVDNGYCKDSVTDSVTINIEAFPKADFTSLNTKGCTPLTVNFSNQSTDAFHYKWLYDNKTDTSKSPTHTFTDTGFHKVILLAYNNQGCVDSIIKDSFIYVSPQPKPQFTYTTKKVCAGIEATFQNQSIFSTKYIWNIDGKTDSTKSPVYTFRQNGNYQVTLTAINLYCQNTDTQTAHILLPDTVKSIFSSDRKAGCPNTEIAFINQSKHSVKQTWYFGDGDTSGIFSPKHIYDSAGKYNVSLVSYSAEGCKDSINLTDYIHILPYPEALFSTDSGTFTCERVSYTYDNKSTHADSFRWSFGDGSPIQITYAPGTLIHSYSKSGSYKITITAFNGYCIDTAVILQQIDLRKPPVAEFAIENTKLCISNATTKFTNQSIFGDSYIWDFGDGTIDTNKNSTHTFTKSGKYN